MTCTITDVKTVSKLAQRFHCLLSRQRKHSEGSESTDSSSVAGRDASNHNRLHKFIVSGRNSPTMAATRSIQSQAQAIAHQSSGSIQCLECCGCYSSSRCCRQCLPRFLASRWNPHCVKTFGHMLKGLSSQQDNLKVRPTSAAIATNNPS